NHFLPRNARHYFLFAKFYKQALYLSIPDSGSLPLQKPGSFPPSYGRVYDNEKTNLLPYSLQILTHSFPSACYLLHFLRVNIPLNHSVTENQNHASAWHDAS